MADDGYLVAVRLIDDRANGTGPKSCVDFEIVRFEAHGAAHVGSQLVIGPRRIADDFGGGVCSGAANLAGVKIIPELKPLLGGIARAADGGDPEVEEFAEHPF